MICNFQDTKPAVFWLLSPPLALREISDIDQSHKNDRMTGYKTQDRNYKEFEYEIVVLRKENLRMLHSHHVDATIFRRCNSAVLHRFVKPSDCGTESVNIQDNLSWPP